MFKGIAFFAPIWCALFLFIGASQAQNSTPFRKIIKVKQTFQNAPGCVAADDFNRDGATDLVVANSFLAFTGSANIYSLDKDLKNIGKESVPSHLRTSSLNYSAVELAHMNKDRLIDIITGGADSGIVIHQHISPRSKTKKYTDPQPRFNTSKPTYLNPFQNKPVLGFRYLGMEAGQFNTSRDRNIDLAVCGEVPAFLMSVSRNIGVVVLYGDGRGGFLNQTQVYYDRCLGIKKVDFDGDGKDELVVLGERQGGRRIAILGEDTRGNFKIIDDISVSGNLLETSRISVGDLTFDGMPDVIVSGWDGKTSGYGNPSRFMIYQVTKFYGQLSLRSGIVTSYVLPIKYKNETIEGIISDDFDADGKADLTLLLGHEGQSVNGKILYYKGSGNKKSPLKSMVEIKLPGHVRSNISDHQLTKNKILIPIHPSSLFHSTRIAHRLNNKSKEDGLHQDDLADLVVPFASEKVGNSTVNFAYILPNLTKLAGPRDTGTTNRRFGVRMIGSATTTASGAIPHLSATGYPFVGNKKFGFTYSNIPNGKYMIGFLSTKYIGGTSLSRLFGGVWMPVFPLLTRGYILPLIPKSLGDTDGIVEQSMPVPTDKSMIGKGFYFFGMGFDQRKKNVLGAYNTQCAEIVVGAKRKYD